MFVRDRYIGYYPASLFSKAKPSLPVYNTLALGSDKVYFYGEIFQKSGPMTKTDMGSGNFASKGWKYAAYIRNMNFIDTKSVSVPYTGVWTFDDSKRYSYSTTAAPGGSGWGSYVYIGGPGAGGVVGA